MVIKYPSMGLQESNNTEQLTLGTSFKRMRLYHQTSVFILICSQLIKI